MTRSIFKHAQISFKGFFQRTSVSINWMNLNMILWWTPEKLTTRLANTLPLEFCELPQELSVVSGLEIGPYQVLLIIKTTEKTDLLKTQGKFDTNSSKTFVRKRVWPLKCPPSPSKSYYHPKLISGQIFDVFQTKRGLPDNCRGISKLKQSPSSLLDPPLQYLMNEQTMLPSTKSAPFEFLPHLSFFDDLAQIGGTQTFPTSWFAKITLSIEIYEQESQTM